MTSSFSFSFSGDDIDNEADEGQSQTVPQDRRQAEDATVIPPAPVGAAAKAASSAFPVQGKPQLPPVRHELGHMLSRLPSKIAYGILEVELEEGRGTIRLPRRELWDVRVQLAAEDDKIGEEGGGADDDDSGLGRHDVRSGIYEGGFKSWESSVDLVKVLAKDDFSPALARTGGPVRMIELGCGTALPSLAVFKWASSPTVGQSPGPAAGAFPLWLTLADYNPSVLYLVTLPNFVLAWALDHQSGSPLLQEALSCEGQFEGELELTEEVKAAFLSFLEASQISLSFLSGGWSSAFVDLLGGDEGLGPQVSASAKCELSTVVVGAETIYSPFALNAFAETLLAVLRKERTERPTRGGTSIVAAKRLYFGVGGSLDDFVDRMVASGAVVRPLREETEGVRRGVVQCSLP